jgi:hypothetical protein
LQDGDLPPARRQYKTGRPKVTCINPVLKYLKDLERASYWKKLQDCDLRRKIIKEA